MSSGFCGRNWRCRRNAVGARKLEFTLLVCGPGEREMYKLHSPAVGLLPWAALIVYCSRAPPCSCSMYSYMCIFFTLDCLVGS